MVEITLKRSIGIKLFCLILIIAICLSMIIHSKQLDCNKCVVQFKTTSAEGNEPISVKMLDLESNLSINKCLIGWNNARGYYSDKD